MPLRSQRHLCKRLYHLPRIHPHLLFAELMDGRHRTSRHACAGYLAWTRRPISAAHLDDLPNTAATARVSAWWLDRYLLHRRTVHNAPVSSTESDAPVAPRLYFTAFRVGSCRWSTLCNHPARLGPVAPHGIHRVDALPPDGLIYVWWHATPSSVATVAAVCTPAHAHRHHARSCARRLAFLLP